MFVQVGLHVARSASQYYPILSVGGACGTGLLITRLLCQQGHRKPNAMSLVCLLAQLRADVHEDVVVVPRGRGVRLLVMVGLQFQVTGGE